MIIYKNINFWLKKRPIWQISATAKLTIERADALIFKEQVELDSLRSKSQEYDNNKEAIENLKNLMTQLKEEQQIVRLKEKEIEQCDLKVMKLHQKHGSLRAKAQSTTRSKSKEKKKLEQNFMHTTFFNDLLSS